MNTALQLKIESIGDDVILDNRYIYKLHSSFENAVNFLSNSGHLISVVTEKVGEGPNNIVVNARTVSYITGFKIISDSLVKINNTLYSIHNVHRYNPFIEDLPAINFGYFIDSFILFKYFLLKKAPLLSSAFLLDDRRKNFFITPFEKNLYTSIKDNVHSFLKGEIDSIKNLKGLGFGLTPQGDDLINGFIIALHLYGKIFNRKTQKISYKIYKLSKGTNVISDTFLRYSVSGKLYSRMKNLLLSMMFHREEVERNTDSLLKIGETSGSDIGTGFILMFEKLLQGGLEWL